MAASRPLRLVLFAKEPAPGRVKTRLAAGIGAEKAAALYGAFLTDLAATLAVPWWEAVLAVEGDETVLLSRIFASGWSLKPQGRGSLGDRLARAAAAAFEEGAERVAMAGSDAPTLSAINVRAAFAALDESDLAVAPAPDGGFSLVALRRPVSPTPLFESVRWSTAFALSDLRRNAGALGLGAELLPEIPDIDVVEDLLPLRERLSAGGRLAPATRAVLATL